MKATILDLRYKTRDILSALDSGQSVTILYHGKPRGKIVPLQRKQRKRVSEHEIFGMCAQDKEEITALMDELRGSRHAL
jgi:antitoxin (DNA-binding transcriptional repressor) of toxin-antitoxin stability system